MKRGMRERAVALCGLMQAVRSVHQLAHAGSADGPALRALVDSLFRFDADSAEAVYGGVAGIRLGLDTLLAQIEGGGQREPALTRISVTVMHLERRLARKPELLGRVREGLEAIERSRGMLGEHHPAVLARLGELYANTVSTVRPRVLVQGNPQYLSQGTVVGEVRALLLAAVRAAVLWRQAGGSYADFFLRRGALLRALRALRLELDSAAA